MEGCNFDVMNTMNMSHGWILPRYEYPQRGFVVLKEANSGRNTQYAFPKRDSRNTHGANSMVSGHNFGLKGAIGDAVLSLAYGPKGDERSRTTEAQEDTRGAPVCVGIAGKVGISK